jgi:hypothetical protein
MRAVGDFSRGLLEGGHWEDLGYLTVREPGSESVGARSLFHSFSVRAIRRVKKWWAIGGVYRGQFIHSSAFEQKRESLVLVSVRINRIRLRTEPSKVETEHL